MNRPAAEVAIDETLVRRLLSDQAPDYAALPLQRVGDHGWDNTVYRLGDQWAVRLPRRASAAALMEHELAWLPELAPRLPLPVPLPVLAGRPAAGYSWPWALVRWVTGEPVGTRRLASVAPLARFLSALHQPAPATAPRNPHRGGPLTTRDLSFREGCQSLADQGLDVAAVHRTWARALAADPYTGPPLWLHGDLHTANVLATSQRPARDAGSGTDPEVSGVIDFGDLTAGDPACDYLLAWQLHADQRAALLTAAERRWPGIGERSRGWAVAWAVAVLRASGDTSLLRRIATAALTAACQGQAS